MTIRTFACLLAQILGVDYKKGLLKWIDEENIPTFLGGKSDGSLVDDIGPWNNQELCHKIGVDIEELRAGKRLASLFHLGTAQSRRYAAAAAVSSSGFQSVARVSENGPQRNSGGSSGYQSPRASESISK